MENHSKMNTSTLPLHLVMPKADHSTGVSTVALFPPITLDTPSYNRNKDKTQNLRAAYPLITPRPP